MLRATATSPGLLLTASVVLLGCPKKERPQPQPPAPVVATGVPSFRLDVLPGLEKSCANAEGCHGDKPTESVELDLRPAAAYQQLVNRPAEARPGAMRVKPGDSGASFLLAKLQGSLVHGEGKPMPLDAQTGAPLSPSPLSAEYLATIARWIEAGAPNN